MDQSPSRIRLALRYARRWRRQHGLLGGMPNRARLHGQFALREAAFKWPVHGNILALLQEGRLRLGRGVLLSEHVQLLGHPGATISIGEKTFLNRSVTLVAENRVEIGDHCLFAPGCFIADNDHRFDDHTRPIADQGFTSRGPVKIGDHVWCGANVVITSGVTIGERCVIGANAVVTRDIPAYSVAAGVPARVVGVNRSRDEHHAERTTPDGTTIRAA